MNTFMDGVPPDTVELPVAYTILVWLPTARPEIWVLRSCRIVRVGLARKITIGAVEAAIPEPMLIADWVVNTWII